MRTYPLLSVTRTATEAVTKDTLVAISAAYPDAGTEKILGVAETDAEIGDAFNVIVKGYVPVKVASGESIDLGEVIGVDAAGMAVASDSASDVIAAFLPAVEIENNYVYLIL